MVMAGSPTVWRSDVQGLRAVAVLLVVAFHAGLAFPGGYVGVDVFFVISGFVIGAALLRELERDGRIRLGRFYVRRIRRLLPALALVLVATNLLALVFSPIGALHATQRTGIAAAAFNANTYLAVASFDYFAPVAELNPLLHTWSLSVEEQFYFVFPLLVLSTWLLASSVGRSRHIVLAAVLATLGGASLMFSILWTDGRFESLAVLTSPELTAFFSMPSRAWEFIAGLLVAIWLRRRALERAAVSLATGAGGLALIFAPAMLFDAGTAFPGVNAIGPVVGTVMLIVAGSGGHDHALDRLLGHRLMQYVGNLSYSWYLWHWPFVVFAGALWPSVGWAAPMGAALSLVPAELSYRFVEQPIRLRPRRPAVLVAAMSLAAPLVVITGAAWISERSPTVSSYQHAVRSHYDTVHGCDAGVPVGERTTGACLRRADDGAGRAVLIGDSNAGHFSDPFVRAAQSNGFGFEIATLARCPLVEALIVWHGVPQTRCQLFVADSIEALVDDPPDVVFIASAEMYIEETIYEVVLVNGETLDNRNEKAAAWAQLLGPVVDRLHAAGSTVVLLETVPKPGWDPRSCAVIRWRAGERGCSIEISRTQMAELIRRTVTAERTAAAGPGRYTLDFFDVICPGDPCRSYMGDGSLVWHDGGHISVDMALTMTPIFDDALADVQADGEDS